MAQKLEYTIGIKADVAQFKTQLNELLIQLNKLGEQVSLTPVLQKSSSAAKELAYYMQKATNPDTGKLNLTAFNQELQKSGKSIQQYATSLNNLGADGRQAFMQVAKAIMSAEQPLKRSNELMDKLWITMKNTMRWQITTNALNTFTGSLETAYGYSRDLNKSLNDIRIVSEKSAENMKQFAIQANRAAKELSTTTTKYTDASLIYFQQGLDEQQVKERTDITIKMANVTGDAVETVSDQMTAVWNNFFENGGQSLEHYADAMTALGAATASSTDEIAGGLEKFSSIADMIGLSFDYAASALATITATTRQSEEVVGTALKTIFARIQGLNLGETLDDGTTLNKYSRALDAVGISIKDQSGELKEMDGILDEMGEKWDTLAKDQQVALAQTVAGVRQYNQLVSLMDNWSYFQENLDIAQNSEGELDKQAQIYAESWEAARNEVRAAAEDIYKSLIDEDFYIAFDKKFLAPLLTGVAGLADGMGGLSGILSVTAVLMNKAYGPKIANTIRDMAANIGIMSSSDEKLNQALQAQTLQAVKENIIFTPSAEAAAREKQILEFQKDSLDLQQQINRVTKGWTDYQKQGFDYLLQERKTLQENLTLYNQIIQETQQQIEDLEYSYAQRLVNFTDEQRASFQQRANGYDFSQSISGELTGYQLRNQELFVDLSEDVLVPEGAYARLRENLEGNIIALTRWQAINTQIKNSQGQVTDETKKLAVALGVLSQDTANSYESQNKWNSFAQIAEGNTKGLSAEVLKLKSALVALGGGGAEAASDINILSQAIRENYVVETQYERAIANADNTERNRALGISLTIKELKALKQALDDGIISQETYGRILATQMNPDFTNDLTKAGSAIAGFQMWVSGLEGLHNTIERMDEDGFTLSTLSSGLMALTMMGSALHQAGLTSLIKPVGKYFKEAAAGVQLFGIKMAAAGQTITRAIPWLMALGIAATALYEIFDLLTVSQEEAQEKIEESVSAYEEEKSKLEELNSELEEAENRIKKLNSQSSLTIVEQEELKKLENSLKLLKEQKAIQEETAANQQAITAQEIADNFQKSTNVFRSDYSVFANGKRYLTQTEIEEDLAKTQDKDTAEELQEALITWKKQQTKNLETLKKALENYQFYQQAIQDGVIENNEATQTQLAEMQLQIKRLRIVTDGELKTDDDTGYYNKYLSELDLDEQFNQAAQGKIVKFSKSLKQTLADYAIDEEDAAKWITNQVSIAASNASKLGLTYDKTGAAVKFVAGLDFQKLQGDEASLEIIQGILDNKTYDLNIKVNYVGLEDIKTAVEAASDQNSTLQDIFDDYSENGFLTAEQVHELLEEDVSLAQYLIDRGNGQYGITQSAVDQFYKNKSVIEEGTSVELEQAKASYQGEGRDRIKDTYSSELKQIAAVSSEFSSLDEQINSALVDWSGNSEYTTADLVNNIMTVFDENAGLFTGIASSNLTELDKVAQSTYSTITTLLTNLYSEQTKLFQSGQIGFKEYSDSLIEIQKANLKLQKTQIDSKYKDSHNAELVKKGVVKQQAVDGKISWVVDKEAHDNYVKDRGSDATEESIKSSEKSLVAQLNAEEEELESLREGYQELNKLRQFDGFKDTMTDYYSYLEPYLDALGHIDTTLNIDVNDEKWKAFNEELFTDFAALDAETRAQVLSSVAQTLGQASITWDEVKSQIREGSTEVSAALTQAMDESATESTSNISQSIGDLLTEVAETIDSFETTISITPNTSKQNSGSLEAAIASGDPSDLPNFTYDVKTGGSADSIKSGVAAIQSITVNPLGGGNDSYAERLGALKYGTQDDKNEASGVPTTGNGSGSKSSTLDKKDKKEVERYLKINRLIEQQNDLLKENETLTDRAVGLDKLLGFDKQLEVLEQQQKYYKRKQEDAEKYLSVDKGELLKELGKRGFAAEFGEDNELLNYEEILNEAIKPLNEIEETWNNLAENQTLVSSEQKEALQAQYDAALDNYEVIEETIKQYLETLDVIRDIKENLAEAARNAADIRLEKITTKADTIIRAKEGRDSLRETYKELWESYGDSLTKDENGRTHIRNIMGLDKQMMEDDLAMLPYYQERLTQLEAMYHSDDENIDKDAVLDEIYDIQEAYLQAATDLNDYIQELKERFPEALEAAKNRYTEFTDALEHNSTIVDLIKQLYELQGVTYKTTSGFNALYKATDTKYQSQLAKADLQKQWYDSIAVQLADAEAALEGIAESDIGYDILKTQRDTLLEEYYEAEAAYLTSAQETLQTAREIFSLELERAMYEFESILTNGLGLSDLQTQYDHYIEENARYFDQVNEAYEIASWYNKLQADIDDENNAAHIAQLKALQEEIDMRAENNTLNQYDLDILEAKYNLLQAQMALEDARNAKNNLQLVRDSQGNWNYQYTADQDNIADAESKVLDAQNEWYNIAKTQTEDITQEIITNWQEAMDAVQEIYDDTIALEEKEEKANEILRYYAEKSVDLEREKWQAINDMTEAGEIAVENYDTTYSDSLANMTAENKNFEEYLRSYLSDCNENFQSFQDKVGKVTEVTGTDMDTLQTNIGKVAEKTDDLREASEDLVPVLHKLLEEVKDLVEQFSNLDDVKGGIVTSINGGGSATELGNESARQATYYDASVDYNALLQWGRATGLIEGGSDEEYALLNQRQNKITDLGLHETILTSSDLKQYEESGEPSATAKATYNKATAETLIKKLLKQAGFDTGGYTGVFDDARLAFLHQKELVLNASDTENMLAAVQVVRELGSGALASIEKALDNNVLSMIMSLGSIIGNYRAEMPQTQLEQTVHIDKIEFPNATDRNEIEEAFRSLTNDAAQWARLRQ